MVRAINWRLVGFFLCLLPGCIVGFVGGASGEGRVDIPISTTKHRMLSALAGPFQSGREVTRACLSCHTEAAAMVRKDIHWTWEFTDATSGKVYGKKHVLNAFCGSTVSNLRECTSCHPGFGWQDPDDRQDVDDKVDCLVCHEQTGNYKKYNYGYSELRYKDKILKKPDYAAMAQSVGRPSRANCGFCHFRGGSGDGAKHGDLDSSLTHPDRFLDVHMNASGLDFGCIICHTSNGHRITGSRYRMRAQDPLGIDRPGRTDHTRASCASCHGNTPHPGNFKLDDHVNRVACQTCHIPVMARGGVETMVHWDWRTAGKKTGNTDVPDILQQEGHVAEKMNFKHSSTHGTSIWAENLVPRYAWFNGRVDYVGPGDKLGDGDSVQLNRIQGEARDPDSRIWPFKRMWAVMPYDSVNRHLVANHLLKSDADDREAFEVSGDWQRSVRVGMAEAGVPFSGEVGFVKAVMNFPLTHMVAPKELSLICKDCHRNGGRMDGVEGIYMPGRKNNPLLHVIGRGFVVLTVSGTLMHATMRVILRRRRRK
ncbi:MAG: tetrathionate reductase family octaheme c-type cytochrome [Magnetococcales bacterium]|nr:tetrathionate reductase family octaheme c-type cytochrome [Magnetococcales bacterium]